MHKALSLITMVSLLASLASAALTCFDSDAHNQEVFTHGGHCKPPTKPRDDGGIIYIPPTRSHKNLDLNDMMKEVVLKEMMTTYNKPMYLESLKAKACSADEFRYYIANCQIKILSRPVISMIPTKWISQNILCSPATCRITYSESISVLTTHSTKVSLSIMAGTKPFGVGMDFMTMVSYGYSNTAVM